MNVMFDMSHILATKTSNVKFRVIVTTDNRGQYMIGLIICAASSLVSSTS